MATRWRLDSCACVLTFEGLNGDIPVKPGVENDCGQHGKGLTPAKLFAAALAFNRASARLKIN